MRVTGGEQVGIVSVRAAEIDGGGGEEGGFSYSNAGRRQLDSALEVRAAGAAAAGAAAAGRSSPPKFHQAAAVQILAFEETNEGFSNESCRFHANNSRDLKNKQTKQKPKDELKNPRLRLKPWRGSLTHLFKHKRWGETAPISSRETKRFLLPPPPRLLPPV